MPFDAKRLSRLDWGVLVAAAVAFVALFLPWYGVSVAGFNASVSGWSTGYGWLGAALMAAAGVWFLLWRTQASLPTAPFSPLFATTAASALGLLLVVVRWASLPRGGGGILGRSFNYGPRAGIWIALIAGIVEVVCAGLLLSKSGETLPWNANPGSSGTPAGPSTPNA